MKKLFFAMTAFVALASCSKDEVVKINQDEIKYNVVTENTTKAANVYCNNNKMSEFQVWAKVGTTDYIGGAGDKVNVSGNTCIPTVTRYWPEGSVDFYAVAGMTTNSISWDADAATPAQIKDFVVDGTVANQVDLLYAKASAQQDDGSVNLNFRHALSQIVFNAKNEHPNLYIEIESVAVCGLDGKGTFTYPTGVTSPNNNDPHTTTTPSNPAAGTQGVWSLSEQTDDINKSYSVLFATPVVLNPKSGNTDVTADLTADNETDKEYSKDAMLLLPQTKDAYDKGTDNTYSGTYFKLMCRIYNVADNTAETPVKTLVYGIPATAENNNKEGAKAALIPASIVWEQGYKYTYTFIFGGNSNGGVEPNPDDPNSGEPDLDNPVLENISYIVSVDEFVPATGNDIEWNQTIPTNNN